MPHEKRPSAARNVSESITSGEWRVAGNERDRQNEERKYIASVEHGAGRDEVAGNTDEKIGHVLSQRENARGAVHQTRRGDDSTDDPLDNPLAGEFAPPQAVVPRESGVGLTRRAGA